MTRNTGRRGSLPPLILRWQEPDAPLPMQVIRGESRNRVLAWFDRHSAAPSGPAEQPFDFCAHVRRLLADIAERCPDFKHIQAPRILVTATQARGKQKHGLQARVTPLRFRHGALIRQRRGVPYHIQRYFLGAHEFLYLLTFCLPRYLDQDFDQKFVTLFHELHHMSPAFDGDLRRHPGRYQFHTHSQHEYDQDMVQFSRAYLARNPDPALFGFLRMNFAQLQARHGTVTAVVVPRPKIIPLVGPYAALGGQQPAVAASTEDQMHEAVAPGRYRHFKGGLYEVVGVARHSETQEEMVVYRALYGEGGLWVRPKRMFLETVVHEGAVTPRFQRLDV
jgi:hypothetical protein